MTRGFVWFPLGTVPGEGTITASARGPAKTDVCTAEPAGRDATQGRLLWGVPGRQSDRLATTPAGQPERGHGGEPERGQGPGVTLSILCVGFSINGCFWYFIHGFRVNKR